MLKWVLPLDTERTLEVLVETLVKKVLPIIAGAQTQDQVLYRTRFTQEPTTKSAYPYDKYTF
jgi:hypothetical protein